MSGRTKMTCCLSSLLLIATAVLPASGQVLVDDFSDGNDNGWTHSLTGEEEDWGPGLFEANSGAYNLKTTGLVPDNGLGALSSFWDASADPFYTDGIWRVTVRAESGGSNVAVILRGNPAPDGASWLLTTSVFGDLQLGDCTGVDCEQIIGRNVGLSRGEDWVIEAFAVGDLITAKMWRVGEPIPDEPQVRRLDAKYPTGQFGVVSFIGTNWNEPAQVDAFFDDIYFTPVPEPSSVALLLAGLAACWASWRKCARPAP
jgi:type II secretory pathway pseudopilin PulG